MPDTVSHERKRPATLLRHQNNSDCDFSAQLPWAPTRNGLFVREPSDNFDDSCEPLIETTVQPVNTTATRVESAKRFRNLNLLFEALSFGQPYGAFLRPPPTPSVRIVTTYQTESTQYITRPIRLDGRGHFSFCVCVYVYVYVCV